MELRGRRAASSRARRAAAGGHADVPDELGRDVRGRGQLSASLLELVAQLEAELARGATTLTLDVLDPDLGAGRYAGELVELDGVTYVHRPFRVWVDLAERLGLRLRTPRALAPPLVRLVLERLAEPPRAFGERDDDITERYGATSEFARIHKLEDPGFVLDLAEAIERVGLSPDARILDLGVNTGDELALIFARFPALARAHFVGVDHSASAIEVARQRFVGRDVTLHVADITQLASLALGRFDLILSIGTLQSAGIDDRALLRTLVQAHLAPHGALVLGFPNCRYRDGEVEYGTRMKNFRQPELGLLVKDVAFYRKYLQQHRRQVFVTGKHYVLVTAIACAPSSP